MDAMASKPPTVRLRRLGQEMLRLRETAGLTREQVAERTHYDQSSIWRLETAKNRPQRRTILVLLELYGIKKPDDQGRYLELLQKSSELNWMSGFEEALPEDYQTYISFESSANKLTAYDNAFVPGQLQTQKYARAVIRGVHPTLPEEDVTRRAEVRARRQESLAARSVMQWLVLDEAILHREVGGPEVMQEQLQHLSDQASRKDIMIQIVPFSAGAHPGLQGPFTIMEFPPPDLALIYIETLTGNLFLEKPDEVELYRANFQQLIAQALSPTDSLNLINSKSLINDRKDHR